MGNIFGIIKKMVMNNLKNIQLMYFKLILNEKIFELFIFVLILSKQFTIF